MKRITDRIVEHTEIFSDEGEAPLRVRTFRAQRLAGLKSVASLSDDGEFGIDIYYDGKDLAAVDAALAFLTRLSRRLHVLTR